jgi:hypothetical protein
MTKPTSPQNMNINKIYNRYLCPNCSQHDCICRLLAPTSNAQTPKPLFPTKSKPVLSSPNLKKPNPASPKSNVKYTPQTTIKKALTLKTPVFIKFNQIQIEKIESKTFNTPTPRQGDITQKEIIDITNLELSTSSPR